MRTLRFPKYYVKVFTLSHFCELLVTVLKPACTPSESFFLQVYVCTVLLPRSLNATLDALLVNKMHFL